MDESKKLPLKRVELSLTKFNEVAIPHHLDLLRQHRANIVKYESTGGWARVRSEQAHARRVCSQLRSLLDELQGLRAQVRGEDLPRFDLLTQRSRDLTLKAIVDYLETSPMRIVGRATDEGSGVGAAGSAVSSDSVGVVAHVVDTDLVQLQVDEQELAVRERELALQGWSELQLEVRALHGAWRAVHDAVRDQRDCVGAVDRTVQTAGDNVSAARADLSAAERLRAGAYGVSGAALGALLGGPLGLIVGFKAGAAALVAGSALGYWGARLVGGRRRKELDGHTYTHTHTTALHSAHTPDDTLKDKTQ